MEVGQKGKKWYHLQGTNRKTGPRKALSSCRKTIGKQDLAVGCREEASGWSNEEMETGSGSRNGLRVRQAKSS